MIRDLASNSNKIEFVFNPDNLNEPLNSYLVFHTRIRHKWVCLVKKIIRAFYRV